MHKVPFGAWLTVLLPLIMLLFVACGRSDGPTLLKPEQDAPDSFLDPSSITTPDELQAILGEASTAADEAEAALGDIGNDSEATRARLDARLQATTDVLADAGYGLIRPRSIVGVGLLPVANQDICGLDSLIEGFANDRSTALAFASVHNLRTSAIPDYLQSLTAGYLIDDANVISHSFRGDLAQPYNATLRAGTAVLVDGDGLPRVRCRGGSPLRPAQVDLDGRIVENAAFADEIAQSAIAHDVPNLTNLSVDGLFTNDPAQALGPPDKIAVSLGDDDQPVTGNGCRYQILLRFVDNRLVDGPGADLQIVELGEAESVAVSIGTGPDDLRYVGEAAGTMGFIDISSVAGPDEAFSVVQLCDGPETDSEVPGSDIDAVAALNSIAG